MAKNNSSNKTFKSKSKVYAIYGNSGNGKTTLAKEKVKDALYINCTLDKLEEVLSYAVDIKELFKYNTAHLFSMLNLADQRIIGLEFTEESDSMLPIKFKVIGYKKSLSYHEAKPSNRYLMLMLLVLYIRNNKKIIIDNLDILFTGSGFKHVLKFLLREIEFGNKDVAVTFTSLPIWQSFCLLLKKEMNKEILITKYDFHKNEFNHMKLEYNHLAYTISILYNKTMKKEFSEDGDKDDTKIVFFPSDSVEY